jgi:hypothetical protein
MPKTKINKTKNKKLQKKNKTKNKKYPLNNQKKNITKKNLLPIVYGKIHMTSCGHCQNLIPEWNILNERMKKHSDVVCYDIEREEQIEKFPLFNNTYKPYGNIQIQGGYPTIYKLHKRGGEIIYYNGPRDNQSLFYWLQGKNVL